MIDPSFIHDPLSLGIGLMAFGVLWILLAALLSIVWPSPLTEDELSSYQTVPPPHLTEGLEALIERVRRLESRPGAMPAAPPPEFDERVRRMRGELDELRRSIAAAAERNRARAELGARVRTLSLGAEMLSHRGPEPVFPTIPAALRMPVVPPAPRAYAPAVPTAPPPLAPPPAPAPREEVRPTPPPPAAAPLPPPAPPVVASPPAPVADETWKLDLENALGGARQERDVFGKQSSWLEEEAARRAAAAKQEADRQAAEQRKAAESAAEAAAREKALADERERFAAQQRSLEREKAAGPVIVPPELEESRRTLSDQAREAGAAFARARDRRDRRQAALARRIERWRRGWQDRLGERRIALEIEARRLEEQQSESSRALREARAAADERLKGLESARERLRFEQEAFEQAVAAPWRAERAETERRAAMLQDQVAALRREIADLDARAAAETKTFEESMSERRKTVRDQQKRWRVDWAALQARSAEQTERETKDLSALRATLDSEKERLASDLADRAARVEAEAKEWERKRGELETTISRERVSWKEQTTQSEKLREELAGRRNALASAVKAQSEAYVKRRAELSAWAEQRLGRIETVLNEARRGAETGLRNLQLEKSALQAVLRREREKFEAAAGAIESEHRARIRGLGDEAARERAEHDRFLAESRARDAETQASIQGLAGAIAELEKTLAAVRRDTELKLRSRRERYERTLLAIEQKSSQEQVQAEARLALQRHELESLERRVTNRRGRLERALQRRQETLEHVYAEAQESLEVVRQGRWHERRDWSAKLSELQREREALEAKRAETGASAEAPEYQTKSRELDDRFEAEKARLSKEAEDYWKSFLDKSAENQKSLERARLAVAQSETELDKREAAANEFVAIVKNQISQLTSLRDFLRKRGDQSRGSSASSGGVA